ncbi:MAG: pyridoxamine 5'-phosphate oxidase family protein [Betaproteobacteria bacterium]|nr:pyridoxamine 5'-phosphate oxidase family protein [Betaproteobacteria bacterium]
MGPARDRALAYLAAHHVMTLATAGPEGPWAAAVFYANEGFDLCFLSSPSSRHSAELRANAAAAATVQEDYADWRAIRGVQLEGRVEELAGDEAERARALYGGKFPIARPGDDTPAPIAAALAKVRWYRFVARHAFWIDNAAGFGKREQVL